MSADKYYRLQKLVEDHRHEVDRRVLLSGAEFYRWGDSVYFGYPDSEYGRSVTKDGRPVKFAPVLIGKPGAGTAKEVAEALNSILKSCRAREKMAAGEAILRFKAEAAQIAEELANKEIAELNSVFLVETEVHKCPACEPPEIESPSLTIPAGGGGGSVVYGEGGDPVHGGSGRAE